MKAHPGPAGKLFCVTLTFTMDPGWHIYWTNPGDSGLPTSVKWILPKGYRVGETRWPTPKRFEEGGLVNYGYDGTAIVLTTILPPKAMGSAKSIPIKAQVSWMACKEQCVQGATTLSAAVKPLSAAKAVSKEKAVRTPICTMANLDLVLGVLLMPSDGARLKPSAVPTGAGFELAFAVPEGESWSDAYFFASKQGIIEPGEPQSVKWWRNGGLNGTLALIKSSSLRQTPSFLEGVLVVQSLQNKKHSFLVKAPIRK